jgi:tetratricopeptide (TPR) repeat protein
MAAMEHETLLQSAVDHHRAGRFGDAAELYRRVLEAEPQQPDALHLLGLAMARLGDPDEALELVAQAVAVAPAHPGYRFSHGNLLIGAKRWAEARAALELAVAGAPGDLAAKSALAVTLIELGESEAAERLLREVLAAEPKFVAAHDNLAALLLKREDAVGAEASARRSLELAPGVPQALNNLASALHKQGRYEEAEPLLLDAIRQRPDFVEAMYNLGLVRARRHNNVGADIALRNALKLAPDDVRIITTHAEVTGDLSLLDESLALAQRAHALDPDAPAVLWALANAWRLHGDYQEAERLMRRTIERAPRAAYIANLGHLLWERGKLDQARELLERTLALDPNAAGARMTLAQCGRVTSADDPNLLAAIAQLERPGLGDEDRMSLEYAVAKSLDDLGRHEESFVHYRTANEIKKQKVPRYEHDSDRLFENACRTAFTPEAVRKAAAHGSQSEVPVFVVGLPRSGTTLTEQIIAAHPAAHGCGELLKLREIEARITADAINRGRPEHPGAVLDLAPDRIAGYARMYLDLVRGLAGEPAQRIVDKMPLNLRYLGLIAVLFPRAHVVHCLRHPVDNCLSIYFQNFGRGNFFANDLGDVARFYAASERIVQVFKQQLELPILDFRYEQVVAEPEARSRALIDFIGLPWDDACLSFHQSDRAVRTASAWQVKQPIYKRSVARWKRYGDAIQPLLDTLREEGVPIPDAEGEA